MNDRMQDHLMTVASRATVIRRALISLRDSSAGDAFAELAAIVYLFDEMNYSVAMAVNRAEQIEQELGTPDPTHVPAEGQVHY